MHELNVIVINSYQPDDLYHYDIYIFRIRELSDQTGAEDEEIHGEDKFNFAEAAILIQGSTMVYGKKVEYVHGLARDFYEQLRDKKTSRKGNSDGEID